MPVEAGARRGKVLRTRSRGGGVSPRVQVAEMQRARLLGAAVLAVEELGWSGVTVAHITSRARISRRTFYDLFENREDCLLAVLQDVVGRIAGEIADAELAGCDWRERVRGGLFVILSFFDREPVLARLCVVGGLRGGTRVLVWREGILARLVAVVDEGRDASARSRDCTVLIAEGLVGAVFGIVHARLLADGRQESLVGLLGELMGLIVLPYRGPAAARSERDRAVPSPSRRRRVNGDTRESAQGAVTGVDDALRDVPMRLTYRTARVLDGVATSPGASNRMVADHAGISDQGQVSKLLARLERLGLLANTGAGQTKGEPNAWTLTALGWRVVEQCGAHDRDRVLSSVGGGLGNRNGTVTRRGVASV